jgi:hypothetical protein
VKTFRDNLMLQFLEYNFCVFLKHATKRGTITRKTIYYRAGFVWKIQYLLILFETFWIAELSELLWNNSLPRHPCILSEYRLCCLSIVPVYCIARPFWFLASSFVQALSGDNSFRDLTTSKLQSRVGSLLGHVTTDAILKTALEVPWSRSTRSLIVAI